MSSCKQSVNIQIGLWYSRCVKKNSLDKSLKGCTTFRFNSEAFQGLLVQEKALEKTWYKFTLANGEVVELKGNDMVEYDGETHSAANLFDTLKRP